MGEKSRSKHLRMLASTILGASSSVSEILEILNSVEQPDFRNDLQRAVLGCLDILSHIERQEVAPPRMERENIFRIDTSLLSDDSVIKLASYIQQLAHRKRMRRDEIISMFSGYAHLRPPSSLNIGEMLVFYVRHLPIEIIYSIIKNELLGANESDTNIDSYLEGILQKRKK